MTSNYHIQKPYVLANLPRSVTQPDGKSVVGEVFGQRPGAKKRRRPEVVVGIDGESTNLYDVSSSQLITSYPVPPQAKFFCPPCSVRIRQATGKNAGFARYTYVATREPARKLSLFKDTVEASGNTSSTSVTASLGRTSAVVFLATTSTTSTGVSPATDSNAEQSPLSPPDLLVVDQEGQVICFNGETLKEKFKATLSALSQDLLPRGSVVRVDFAQMGLATDVLKGLALGNDYLSGIFPLKVEAGGFNPDMLVVISHVSNRQGGITRYLHVLAVDPSSSSRSHLVQVHSIRLPTLDTPATDSEEATQTPIYRLDMPSGSLFSLEDENVVSYDLSRSIPRVVSRMSVPGATSFLRLSKSSVLMATPTAFSVYNPVFKSLQASTNFDFRGGNESGSTSTSSFALFFSQLELAVGIVDSDLVVVQLEPPKARSRKRRADGLLIDSIGRGVSQPALDEDNQVNGNDNDDNTLLNKCVPGTVSARYLAQYWNDVQAADKLLEEDNVTGFDDFLAEKLDIQNLTEWRWERPLDGLAAEGKTLTNGTTEEEEEEEAEEPVGLNGTVITPTRRSKYPEADRRWIVYAISCVLAVEESPLRLTCKLPRSDILNYLVDAGHLSVSNTLSALRSTSPALQSFDDAALFIGESLPNLLASVDPSLDLLLRWLYATKLSATELLSAILLLMRSLELVVGSEAAPKQQLLLTNGTTEEDKTKNTELDQLDQQLHLAQYLLDQVDKQNDPRNMALDIAIGKLGSCPPVTTVQALRRIFKTDEIRSLIEVLRKQLVDQGWATRYMDMTAEKGDDADTDNKDQPESTPLDYSIRLIADLLCRCIDAVRPGEWLIDDDLQAMNGAGETDDDSVPSSFFAMLKLQVGAALEGVQEAMYLRGLIGEAVRYATGVQKMEAAAVAQVARAVTGDEESKIRPARVAAGGSLVSAQGPVANMLPLGLKAPVNMPRHEDIMPTKVTHGGEVLKRSKRELGHLTSKKVGQYTLERVVL